jgi:photosystem II stability/assembly factor-like uncharacterized protein
VIGIDFGTTNSAVAMADESGHVTTARYPSDDVLPFQGSRQDDFFVANPKTAVVVMHGDGKTYGTEDAGQSWHVLLATTLASQIQFADAEVGWTLGSNRKNWRAAQVNYTVDGGRHWKQSAEINFPPQNPDDYRLSFPQRDRAYVIGPHGMIYRYRIVPWEYAAANILPAPLMSSPPTQTVPFRDNRLDLVNSAPKHIQVSPD